MNDAEFNYIRDQIVSKLDRAQTNLSDACSLLAEIDSAKKMESFDVGYEQSAIEHASILIHVIRKRFECV